MPTRVDDLKRKLEQLKTKIASLEAAQSSDVSFDLNSATAGPSGPARGVRRQQIARGKARERMIDRASELVDLYKERGHLQAQIEAEERRPKREAALAEYANRVKGQIQASGTGVRVMTPLYGEATVVRINAKSATIETDSGYREAIPYQYLGRVIGDGA